MKKTIKNMILPLLPFTTILPLSSCAKKHYSIINETSYQTIIENTQEIQNYTLEKYTQSISYVPKDETDIIPTSIYRNNETTSLEKHDADYISFHMTSTATILSYGGGFSKESTSKEQLFYLCNDNGIMVEYQFDTHQYITTNFILSNIGFMAVISKLPTSFSTFSKDEYNLYYYVTHDEENTTTDYYAFGFDSNYIVYFEWYECEKYLTDEADIKSQYDTKHKFTFSDINCTDTDVPYSAKVLFNK